MKSLDAAIFVYYTVQAGQAFSRRGRKVFTTFLSGRSCAGYCPEEGSRTFRGAQRSSAASGVAMVRCILLLVGVGILALQPVSLFAQATDATLLGHVTDPAGLAVPEVSVTARQEQTGYVRTVLSNATGDYLMLSMPVGSYTLGAEKTGFSRYEQTGIQLTVGAQIRADIPLAVGSLSQKVEVKAEATMVNTVSGQVSGLVDSARIVELPLSGRNVLALTALQPGVTDVYAPQTFARLEDAGTMNISGGRTNEYAEYVDGAISMSPLFGYGLNLPPPDSVQEFSMLLNSYAAEYGRTSGGSVNAVTKSGTNQLHGTAYEFVRNDVFDARTFFAPSVTPSRQNQFGASAGYYVPLPRGKRLYVFGNYEGLRVRTAGVATSAYLPTAQQESGVFPYTITDPTTGQPFPNNTIPPDRINPISTAILAKIPTAPCTNCASTFFGASPDNLDEEFIRGDYDINSKNRLAVTVFNWKNTNSSAFSRSTNVPGWNPGFQNLHILNPTIALTSTFSPTLLNEFHAGTVPANEPFGNFNHFDLHSLGSAFPSVNTPPWIIVGNEFSLEPDVDGFEEDRDAWFTDTLAWIKGHHTVKTGIQFWRQRMRFTCNWLTASQSLFDGSITGDPIADFLLGTPALFTTLEPVTLDDGESTVMGAFVQDDYKVTHGLTLNLGLRWDLQTPWVSPQNVFGTFLPGHQSTVFPDAPPDFVYPGDPGIPRGLTPTRWTHFSPRLAFAYSPSGKTVVRSGFGVFFGTLIQDSGTVVESPPFQVYSAFTDPPGGLSNPLEGEPSIFPTSSSFVLPISTFFKDWHQTQPYSMQYNLTVERQFSTNWSAQAGYVGRQGRHLFSQIEANPAIPGPGATLANEQQRRPYNPDYASMIRGTTDGNSYYNSLQSKVEHRMAHGFTVLAAYTWSKSMDTNSCISEWCGVSDPFDPHFDRSLSDFDRRHVFSLSFVSYLPQVHGSSAALRKLANGWEFTGIASYKTGVPYNIITGQDTQMTGVGYETFGTARPQLVGDPYVPHTNKNQYLQEYFNTNAFALPCPVALVSGSCPVPALGNFGRNVLIGPGYADWDLGLFKDTNVTERAKIQFRSEFFNVFNRANFSNPDSYMPDTTFGVISSAGDGRTIQLSLKLIF